MSYPLGATYDGAGVNFALFSENATAVELCLFGNGEKWFQERQLHGSGIRDIGWVKPDGGEMSDEDRKMGFAKSLGVRLNGTSVTNPDAMGERVTDIPSILFLVLSTIRWVLSFLAWNRGRRWTPMLDTYQTPSWRGGRTHHAGEAVRVEGRSLLLLRWPE